MYKKEGGQTSEGNPEDSGEQHQKHFKVVQSLHVIITSHQEGVAVLCLE
jgi:hypothetical protein